MVNDLLVWHNDPYGHVAVTSEVHGELIVIIQQNIYRVTTQRFPLLKRDGTFSMSPKKPPAGWLRLL
ncbi:CHAP domain-containing protein [Rubritalea sp.]|uniref:CHAP domain-containing protein n=1 Tax=Rubritalea sp. TaxID=2109375 RepID=UPI003242A358